MKPKIVNETPITMVEIKEELMKIKKRVVVVVVALQGNKINWININNLKKKKRKN